MKKFLLFIFVLFFCTNEGISILINPVKSGQLVVSGGSRYNDASFDCGRNFNYNVLSACSGNVYADINYTISIGKEHYSERCYLAPGRGTARAYFTDDEYSTSYSCLLTMAVSYYGYTGRETLCCVLDYAYTALSHEDVLGAENKDSVIIK